MSSFVQSLSKGLFWDVDPETVDEVKHRRFIIQRVLERGDFEDMCGTFGANCNAWMKKAVDEILV